MNILFLSLSNFDFSSPGIYTDLIRYFGKRGHHVKVLCPLQRRDWHTTHRKIIDDHVEVIRVSTLNVTGKCSILEKGLATLLLEGQFLRTIKKQLSSIQFDLILYSTPPITFERVVSFIKKRDNACSYLLLKDIFPQNAVDLQLIKKDGLLHRYFKNKEKKLYQISDRIGCMSPANKAYLLKHHPEVSADKLEINPNSISPRRITKSANLREKYGLPRDKVIFVYGGNIGKPQGVDFIIECIHSNEHRHDSFFLIIGNGTEYEKLRAFFLIEAPRNAKLIPKLPKKEYDVLCASCDVGLIFLDPRFTIPNFPSRILSYMQAAMPFIASVDTTTDVGKIAEDSGFGVNSQAGDLESFNRAISYYLEEKQRIINDGEKAYEYLIQNFSVSASYKKIGAVLDN